MKSKIMPGKLGERKERMMCEMYGYILLYDESFMKILTNSFISSCYIS